MMSDITEAALAWLAERPRLKGAYSPLPAPGPLLSALVTTRTDPISWIDARILAGINTLVSDLNNVMPLINKDWQHAMLASPSASATPNQSLSKAVRLYIDRL